MKQSFSLLEPEDALKLKQGVIREYRITPEMLSSENLLIASEILIAINEADNLDSQVALISRALNFGWTPLPAFLTEPAIAKPKTLAKSGLRPEKLTLNQTTVC